MNQILPITLVLLQSEIFKALVKTRLLVGDKKESQYSRCGRTDKGVSSVGQVSCIHQELAVKWILLMVCGIENVYNSKEIYTS